MDLVEIESTADGRNVVFWEAKLVTDGRIRSRSAVVADKNPEVLKQLSDYRKFLNAVGHAQLVANAYRNSAILIVKLREMADALGEVYPLGNEVLGADSSSKLGVDRTPRLVVLNKVNDNQVAWIVHAKKLRDADVAMTVIDEGGPYSLRPPT